MISTTYTMGFGHDMGPIFPDKQPDPLNRYTMVTITMTRILGVNP